MNKLAYLVNHYRNKPLLDQYEYNLYLDAIWVQVKELNIKNRLILIALGVKLDSTKEILAFKLAKSESEAEWLGLVNDLYCRGLKGFNLFLSDKRDSLKSTNPLERINRQLRKITRRLGYFQNQKSLDVFTYLTLKQEGLIIDSAFEAMPDIKQKNASLEFANKC